MNNSAQPYKLGNGQTVGGAAAKAGAEIGTAISEGVQAVAGVKKHRNALQHIAEQNQLGHERWMEKASHGESLIAKAKGYGSDLEMSGDGHTFAIKSRSVKGSKGNKPPKSAPPKKPKGNTAPPKKTQLALAPGNPPRLALPQGKGPTKPEAKTEAKPANATVKPMLALPPGKSDAVKSANSDKMKNFNQKKREVRQRVAAERAAGNRPKRSTPRTVAGKKYGSSMPTIIESLDQTPETTRKNIDKAWAYAANKRKVAKKMASIPAKKDTK